MSTIKVDNIDSKDSTGDITVSRPLVATLTAGSINNLNNLLTPANASVTAAKMATTDTLPAWSGINLTALNANNLGSGTVSRARGGTGLTTAGASGQVLTSDGTNWTSVAPAGGGGLWEYIGTTNFSAATNLEITGFTTDYRIELYNMGFSASNANLNMVTTGDNTNFQSTAHYRYTTMMPSNATTFDNIYNNNASALSLTNSGVGNDFNNTSSYFEIESAGAADTTATVWQWQGQFINYGGDQRIIWGAGQRTKYGAAPHNSSGIKLNISSGNMTGSYRKYKRITA